VCLGGYVLTRSLFGWAVQLIFLTNSPPFNICRRREHFENGVDRSVRTAIAIRVGDESGVSGYNEWLSVDYLQVRAYLSPPLVPLLIHL